MKKAVSLLLTLTILLATTACGNNSSAARIDADTHTYKSNNTERTANNASALNCGYTYELNGYNEIIITGVNDSVSDTVIIPSTLDGHSVTVIGDAAFKGCDRITSVVIPDSVTDMGDHAFQDCTNLERVSIGNGITTISYWAFYNCKNLDVVKMADNVTAIGHGAFMCCENLTTITFGKSVSRINGNAFMGCNNLENVYYRGNALEKEQIYIQDFNNEALFNAMWHCNSTPQF